MMGRGCTRPGMQYMIAHAHSSRMHIHQEMAWNIHVEECIQQTDHRQELSTAKCHESGKMLQLPHTRIKVKLEVGQMVHIARAHYPVSL